MSLHAPELIVPNFITENPHLVEQAYGTDLRMTLGEITTATQAFVAEAVPDYHEKITNPLTALSAKKGNCVSRAALIHGLISNFEHIQPAIVITRRHAFNVAVEKQGNDGIIVENDMVCEDEVNNIDKGIVLLKPKVAAATEKAVQHDFDSAVVYYAHESRQRPSALVDVWFLKVAGSNYGRVLRSRPEDTSGISSPELRRRAILIGQSATCFVNSVTGHEDLNSGDRALEVVIALEAFEATTVS